jgi:hypothetical protein
MRCRLRDDTAGGSVYVCGDAQQGIEQGVYGSGGKMRSREGVYHMVS